MGDSQFINEQGEVKQAYKTPLLMEAKYFCDLKPIFMASNGLMGDYLINSGDGGCREYLTVDFIFRVFWMQTLATQELEANLALKEILCSSSQHFITAKDTEESLGNLEGQTLPH